MSKTTHTEAPWEPHFEDGIWIQSPNPDEPVICDLLPRDADSYTLEDEANAYLIAAAPDLLEALIKVVAIADRRTDEFDAARAAIAKAKGIKSDE
jgi:hypothetical protein